MPKERLASEEFMLRYVDESLAKGQKRITKNPRDSQAYFAMALATIVKVRWAVRKKSYLTVAHETSHAWGYMQKAKEANPQNSDLYLPIGMFHYHIDHLPGLTRFLSALLITSGDRRLGLQELGWAVEKGDLLKELARAELAEVLINFEKQPAQALPLILSLKDQFPQNYNFSFALSNIFAELHRFEDAFAIARELEKHIQAGKPPYAPQLLPRLDNLLGRIYFRAGEYGKAQEHFRLVLKDEALYNARNRAMALLHLGMMYDIRKERKQAEECYSRILEIEGGEGSSQVQAKKYLHTPYVLAQ